MTERAQAITLHGNPLTLAGDAVRMGHPAPDVTLLDNDLKPVKLSDHKEVSEEPDYEAALGAVKELT